MTSLERYVVLANSVMAAVAFAANLYGAIHTDRPWRLVRALIAALAAIYSVAYLVLFVTRDIVPWSSTMRGVSLLSWPIVWILPALVNIRLVRNMRAVLGALNSEDAE